jgi:hypothetical protein
MANKSFVVTWSAPPLSQLNGNITHYIVEYALFTSSSNTPRCLDLSFVAAIVANVSIIAPNLFSWTLMAASDASVAVRVAAATNIDKGPFSECTFALIPLPTASTTSTSSTNSALIAGAAGGAGAFLILLLIVVVVVMRRSQRRVQLSQDNPDRIRYMQALRPFEVDREQVALLQELGSLHVTFPGHVNLTCFSACCPLS